jgi:hypothetical protein
VTVTTSDKAIFSGILGLRRAALAGGKGWDLGKAGRKLGPVGECCRELVGPGG